MALFDDARVDSADLADLVNGSGLVTTRYGNNPKKSWKYMEGEFGTMLSTLQADGESQIAVIVNDLESSGESQLATVLAGIQSDGDAAIDNFTANGERAIDDFDDDGQSAINLFNTQAANDLAEFNQTLDQYKESRGFNNKGAFAEGFTYELPNDVGIDASGNPWIYNGTLPFTVAAGTAPTAPTYTQVTYGTAAQVSMNTSDTVQSFADSFALKIFQSPTDGGLTEIQTRTVNENEVYEVRKTYGDSLATIYSDAAGTTEIAQNGTDNKSGSDGVVEFYIADGDYYVEVDGVKSNLSVIPPVNSSSFSSVESLKDDAAKLVSILDYNDFSASTVSYYGGWAALNKPIGGASYVLTTLQRVRDAKSDQSWTPDGYADHYINDGSNNYVAVLSGNRMAMESRGLREGASYGAINKLVLESSWSEVDPSGGVLEFGFIDAYFDEVTLTITGTSAYKNERGFIGAGAGNTKLNFANSINTPVIQNDSNPAFFTKWEGFTANATNGTKLPYFFNCLIGIPRTKMSGLQFINFKDPMRIHAWVSEFTRIESLNCKIGFTWQSGTSMDISACYALTCDYGHLVGCRLDDDGTFNAGTMLSYTDFSAIAADNNTTADYVVGDAEFTSINNSGSEGTEGAVIYWPELVGQVGTQNTRTRKVKFNNLANSSSDSLAKGFLIGRENLYTEFNGVGISSNISSSNIFDFENSLSFSNSVLNLDINDYSGNPVKVDRDCTSVSVDGYQGGNVADNQPGTMSVSSPWGTTYRSNKGMLDIRGNQEVRFSLIGAVTGRRELCQFDIEITPSNSTGIASTLFTGKIHVGAQADAAGATFIQTNVIGGDPLLVDISAGASIKNAGGTDIIVTFTGDGGASGVAYQCSYTASSSALSTGEHYFVSVN